MRRQGHRVAGFCRGGFVTRMGYEDRSWNPVGSWGKAMNGMAAGWVHEGRGRTGSSCTDLARGQQMAALT